MAKTITVSGQRLTEAQARILAEAFEQSQRDYTLVQPRRGESIAYARLAGRGLLRFETRFARSDYYSITLYGKSVAAALKEEAQ